MKRILIFICFSLSVEVGMSQTKSYRFGGEIWQGINFVSVTSPSTQVGYSRSVALSYDYHKKGSAFSFGASLQAGAYRFRWANNEQIILSTNHGYLGCLLTASYVFKDRYFLGPGLMLQWLSDPIIYIKDYNTRMTISHSDYNETYGHIPFQPAFVLQGAMALDQKSKFILKLALMQHVSDLMSRDYTVDFLTTPPAPITVMPGNVKPFHIQLGFCFRPLKSDKKKEEE